MEYIPIFEENSLQENCFVDLQESARFKIMATQVSRKDLYDQVWAEPMTHVARKDEHQEGNEDFKTALITLVSLASKAPEIFKSSKSEVKRALIAFVFSNLKMDGENLRVSLREPFRGFLKVSGLKGWLGR